MKLLHDLLRGKYRNCANVASGFTVLELLVVISIASILLGLTLFLSMDAYKRYIFRAEQQILVSVLEKARSRAINNIYQSPHGVCFYGSTYIIFRGVCTADDPANEYIAVSKSIAQNSHFETLFPVITFTQRTATTTAAVVQITDGVRVADIVINHEGTISW